MNFNQWRNYAVKSEVAKITYVCGEQSTLVELVLDDIKKILQVPVTDYVTIDASQSVNVWEVASQYPLDPDSNRLVVVRHAEKINCWNELTDWLAHSRKNPKNFLVFVSDESDAPIIYNKGKRVGYFEHIEIIRTKGKFIKCSQPNEDDLSRWCQSYGLSVQSADYLIQRTAGDTAAIYSVLKKIKIWSGSPNPKALELFCQEQVMDNVADYLILQDKKSALLALKSLNPQEYSKIISKLDVRLDCMADMYRCVIRRMYDADIATATGIKIFLVKKFKPVAKEYDVQKLKYRRQLITMIDAAIQSGAKTGVMESLITLW